MIQAKLKVNQPGDIYEQEADRTADRVMATPTHPAVNSTPPPIQRFSGQAHGRLDAAPVPGSVDHALASPGRPLEPALQQEMEQRFGDDFSKVRVHSDAAAERSARDVRAHAYTVGRDIVFGPGRFAPGTHEGRRLIAHELVHVQQQHDRPSMMQKQPEKPAEKSPFEFMLGNVQGRLEVLSVLRPTDPIEFLSAFEKKGDRLIDAYFRWLNNNLTQVIADAMVKGGKNPLTNLDKERLNDIGIKAFGKLVTKIAEAKASEVGSTFLRVINVGGKAATAAAKRFGGVLVFIGAVLVQTFISSLFDKTDEIVRKAVKKVATEVSKVVNDAIIPGVRASATAFGKFMKGLKDYVSDYVSQQLEESSQPPGPTEGKPRPKSKPTAKPKPQEMFSVGEGSDKISVQFDPSVPLTEARLDALILDLANTVLAIDEVVPRLESDLSLYQRLAVQAGVFTGDVAQATPGVEPGPEKGEKVVSSSQQSFRVKGELVAGETQFEVPSNGIVAVTSSAHYDTDVDVRGLPKDARPPLVYRIVLRRGKNAVSVPRQYRVGESETGEWYNLEQGKYHLSIEKGGNPNFTLEGNLRIVVKRLG